MKTGSDLAATLRNFHFVRCCLIFGLVIGMEKIKRTLKTKLASKDNGTVGAVASVLAGFILSFGKIIGFPWAMNAAASAVFPAQSVGIFLGSLAGYTVTGSLEKGIIQLCAILVIGVLWFINPFGLHKDEPAYCALNCTVVLMVFGCVFSAAVPGDTYSVSMRMVNALMSGCAVFAAKTVTVNKNRCGVYDLTGISGVYIGILYVMLIAALSSLPLPMINLGRIAAVTVLLFLSRKYKNAGGATAGALAAVGTLICQPAMARNTLILAVSGLICGAFTCFGMLITAIVFLGVSLIGLVIVGVNADTYKCFADLVIGTMLFAVIPNSAVNVFTKKVSAMKNPFDLIGQATSSKLSYASCALGGIREQLTLVSAAMDRQNMKNKPSVFVERSVCRGCEMYEMCFKNRERIEKSFSELDDILERYNGVSFFDINEHMRGCTEKKLLCDGFNSAYEEILSQKAEDMRTREMREFLINQLSSMEEILGDLSFRTSNVRNIEPVLSAEVKEYFSDLGYQNAKVSVYSDENLSVRADVYLTAEFKCDLVKTTAGISAVLDCDMDIPVICREKNLTRISFCELPEFETDIGVFTASLSGEYSGDSYEIFDGDGNEKYVLFSDGMGTGKRARLDSTLSVRLVSRLVRSGMALSTAHRFINSTLRVKGWEESFATLDLLKIDLKGGSADFLKAGAVQSRLCRDGSVIRIGGQSFPAGILDFCPPDESAVKLFDGDMLMINSDGIDDEKADKLAYLAMRNEKLSAKDIIGQMGSVISEKAFEDDVTLILVKFSKKR